MTAFIKLPITVNDPSLPVIPAASVRRFSREDEASSFDHWIFDTGDAAGLTGRTSGTLLTPEGTGATYGANFVTINPATGNGLRSTLMDARKQTVCAVVRPNNSPATLHIAGSRNTTAGSQLTFTSSLANLTAAQTPVFGNSLAGPFSAGAWYFVALSESDALGTTTQIIHASGGSAVFTGGSLKTLTGAGIALGNSGASLTTGGTISAAEFILFDRALSAAELSAVYTRSKARMAERGITVL